MAPSWRPFHFPSQLLVITWFSCVRVLLSLVGISLTPFGRSGGSKEVFSRDASSCTANSDVGTSSSTLVVEIRDKEGEVRCARPILVLDLWVTAFLLIFSRPC